MAISEIKIYDLIPKPIQEILKKIGLDERFLNTFFTLTIRPSRFDTNKNDIYSRPFEFLASATSIVSILLAIILLNGIEEINTDNVTNIISEHLVEWIVIYLMVIVISFISMHYDLLWFGFFHDKRKPKLTYTERLTGITYLTGCYLIWISPLFVYVLIADDDLQKNKGLDNLIGTLLWILQLRVAAHLLYFDFSRYIRFLKIASWASIGLYVGIICLTIIWGNIK